MSSMQIFDWTSTAKFSHATERGILVRNIEITNRVNTVLRFLTKSSLEQWKYRKVKSYPVPAVFTSYAHDRQAEK